MVALTAQVENGRERLAGVLGRRRNTDSKATENYW